MTLGTIKQITGETFASLGIRNYKLYFIGQGFSHSGGWMQTVALGWLVLDLTGSGTVLGSLLALRFAPMLLGGLFAGTIVDRFDKRKILYTTQASAALIAGVLAALIFTDTIAMWMVYAAALIFGVVDAFDRPARQTFVHDMVGPENLRNAVALNSTLANVARAIGPLLAGILIASVGIAFCFFANAVSFVIFIAMLMRLKSAELRGEKSEGGESSSVLAGVRYALSMPLIKRILLSMAVIGTLSYEFQVSLPLLAKNTFFGNAADYAALLSAMGAGSIAGGLFSASRKNVALHEFVLSAFLFGVSICITAIMPSLGLAVAAMIFVGFFSITMSSTANTMIQLESAPHMRGRVMSLWSMALFGSTLIGAPIIGFIGEHGGARWALAAGGLAALTTAFVAAAKIMEYDKLLAIPAFIRLRREETIVAETKV